MLLWLSTATAAAPTFRFIKSQQPFGHQPQTAAPQSGLRGGIYLAVAVRGWRPSITKSPRRVDLPKDILARASFARVTCRNKLCLYFIRSSPRISIPKMSPRDRAHHWRREADDLGALQNSWAQMYQSYLVLVGRSVGYALMRTYFMEHAESLTC